MSDIIEFTKTVMLKSTCKKCRRQGRICSLRDVGGSQKLNKDLTPCTWVLLNGFWHNKLTGLCFASKIA